MPEALLFAPMVHSALFRKAEALSWMAYAERLTIPTLGTGKRSKEPCPWLRPLCPHCVRAGCGAIRKEPHRWHKRNEIPLRAGGAAHTASPLTCRVCG